MKAVFDTRAGSGYDDDIASRYHFPDRYLAEARRSLGDWIVYREPRRQGGREGYVATARVARIEPDRVKPRHHYAVIDGYLPFDVVVPLRSGQSFYESLLSTVSDPKRIGAALQGRSVRIIPDGEFGAIVRAGLQETLAPNNALRLELDDAHTDLNTQALLRAPVAEQERRIEQLLVNRRIRDAAFRRAVVDAYDNTCAVTRLRIMNGGGRAEAQAAHIMPVADGGPDVVQNGLALSSTAHWLFDRHLITLTDDFGLLISHNKIPAEFRSLLSPSLGRIHLPNDRSAWPYLPYVQRHREKFAGG